MKTRPTRMQIARAVCKMFDVGYEGMGGVKSDNRSERLSIARATIVHLGKHYEYSYPQITPYAGYAGHAGAQGIHKKYREGGFDESPIYSAIGMTREDSLDHLKHALDTNRQAG